MATWQPPPPISSLPPELLFRILELAVEGLPATFRMRASILRHFALVARDWREPAQVLLESRVHIDSYHRARAFLDRPRRLERPLVFDELIFFFDFAPEEEGFYPLTEFMTQSICQLDCEVRFLHLRSALYLDCFDLRLLLLPAFRELRHLRLDMPLEVPADFNALPLRLRALTLSGMVDQPLRLFKALLPDAGTSLTSLSIFVVQSGTWLHERLLEAAPKLTRTIRRISIGTHWAPLPDSLLAFLAACRHVTSVALSGVVLAQVELLLKNMVSPLEDLGFSLPRSASRAGSIEALFEHLLRQPGARHLRYLTATRRIEGDTSEKPKRVEVHRGGCACVYEFTTRRPLP